MEAETWLITEVKCFGESVSAALTAHDPTGAIITIKGNNEKAPTLLKFRFFAPKIHSFAIITYSLYEQQKSGKVPLSCKDKCC